MTNYKVVIGEIIVRDVDTGEILNDGRTFPVTHSNIITDSDEIATYLVKQLGIRRYKLIKMDHKPHYLEHELN